MQKIPNIYFVENQLVYGALAPGGFLSKGFSVQCPDFEHADEEVLDQASNALQAGLACLGEHDRMQLRWTSNSDYLKELLQYHENTQSSSNNAWSKRQRNEKFCRFYEQMERRELRRERFSLYVSVKIPKDSLPKGKGVRAVYKHLLDAGARHFEQCEESFHQIFQSLGGAVKRYDDFAHFVDLYEYFNPSAADDQRDLQALFDPKRSVAETCWNGETAPLERPDHGFWRDGYYHAIIAMKRPPKATFSSMMRQLTSLAMIDYQIVVNIKPLDVRKEIEKEESEHEKLHRTFLHNRRYRMLATMKKKQVKIDRLMLNHVQPYELQLIVIVRDREKEGLLAKQTAVRTAISRLQGAQPYDPCFPTSSWNYFCAAVPGWCGGGYDDFTHYLEDRNVADMFPLGATSEGSLENAEALYPGQRGNLIGVRTFTGIDEHASPQPALMIGKAGSGKSMLCIDLLIQTLAHYAFTVILDEGLSYQCYAQLCHPDAKPIIIEPNGGITFNYLDTRGLPLSSMQVADASAMALLLVGHHADEDRNRLRLAHLVHGINQLYHDSYGQWRTDHSEAVEQVARHALALQCWQRQRMPAGATFLDAFVSFRDWSMAHEAEAQSILAAFDEEAIARMTQAEDESTDLLRNLAFAYMRPEDMPTHRQFQELMSMPSGQGKEAEEIRTLATFLEPWCSYGNYGPLLDGVSNVSLDASLAHFEFGCIPESARELRSVASFLITNYVRNEIMKRPRGLRKRVILEELSAFLMNPEGERITRDFFERMRKYNCWVMAIIQQYARLCESPVRNSVMSNIRSAYILKQSDREEVDRLGEALGLQEVTKQAILSFPEPSAMGDNPFASFVYYEARDHRPTIAIGRHVASAEMLYMSASSGQHVEQRTEALQNTDDIGKRILERVHRPDST